MRDERGYWYLLTGVLIGAVLGLLYAWLVQPVQYTHTSPASLRSDFKDQYRRLISAAFLANGDLVRAKARLDLLNDEDSYRVLAEQAQRSMAEGASFDEARAMGLLAAAIKQGAPVISPTLPPVPASPLAETTAPEAALTATLAVTLTLDGTPLPLFIPTSPSLSATASSLQAPLLALTPSPTPGAPFVLVNREQLCDSGLGQAQIQVLALDAAAQPVSGVEIIVTWAGGENHFFTGLQPEISVGYADFTMTPGITYTLRLAEGGQPIPGLSTSECKGADGGTYLSNWRLEFSQP